jgi:NDP-sugar pyrophosphorylase family protein
MKLAIIGAGEGSRLKEEGISVPKPLVKICGTPLLERIIRIAAANGLSSAHLIVNEAFGEVKDYLESIDFGIPIECRLMSTPSSMHTLFELAPQIKDEPFCMTTVDTVFREEEFAGFISYIRAEKSAEGVLAVTDFIDDEKPLCVSLDSDNRIRAFADAKGDLTYATGGIYYFRPEIFDEIPAALEKEISRLRNFLRLLVEKGYDLRAYPFSKIIDVDHVSDIQTAERFLSGGG